MDTHTTVNVALTDDELRLVNSALHSFVSTFGHDEADVLHAVQHLLDKLTRASGEVSAHPG